MYVTWYMPQEMNGTDIFKINKKEHHKTVMPCILEFTDDYSFNSQKTIY